MPRANSIACLRIGQRRLEGRAHLAEYCGTGRLARVLGKRGGDGEQIGHDLPPLGREFAEPVPRQRPLRLVQRFTDVEEAGQLVRCLAHKLVHQPRASRRPGEFLDLGGELALAGGSYLAGPLVSRRSEFGRTK